MSDVTSELVLQEPIPDVTEPEVIPDVTEPEVTESEVIPDVTEPDVTESDVVLEDVTESDVVLEDVTESDVVLEDVTESDVVLEDVTESDVTVPEVTEPEVTEPDVTVPEVTESEVIPDVTESDVVLEDVTEPDVTVPDVTEPELPIEEAPIIEIILPAPDPLMIQLQDCTKFALFVGLNYNNQLVNRITTIDAAYTEITSKYNYDASNTLVLYEPNYEQLIKTLQTLVGYSPHLTEIIIYYSGYGTAQMDKVMIASESELNQGNFVPEQRFCQPIDMVSILKSSCCKTMCVLDTCPMEPGIPVRWGADVYGHIKIIVIQESDELSTNKTALIQKMIQSYLHITQN